MLLTGGSIGTGISTLVLVNLIQSNVYFDEILASGSGTAQMNYNFFNWSVSNILEGWSSQDMHQLPNGSWILNDPINYTGTSYMNLAPAVPGFLLLLTKNKWAKAAGAGLLGSSLVNMLTTGYSLAKEPTTNLGGGSLITSAGSIMTEYWITLSTIIGMMAFATIYNIMKYMSGKYQEAKGTIDTAINVARAAKL